MKIFSQILLIIIFTLFNKYGCNEMINKTLQQLNGKLSNIPMYIL